MSPTEGDVDFGLDSKGQQMPTKQAEVIKGLVGNNQPCSLGMTPSAERGGYLLPSRGRQVVEPYGTHDPQTG